MFKMVYEFALRYLTHLTNIHIWPWLVPAILNLHSTLCIDAFPVPLMGMHLAKSFSLGGLANGLFRRHTTIKVNLHVCG